MTQTEYTGREKRRILRDARQQEAISAALVALRGLTDNWACAGWPEVAQARRAITILEEVAR